MKRELRLMLSEEAYGALMLEATHTPTAKSTGVRYAASSMAEELLTARYSPEGAGREWLERYKAEEQAVQEARDRVRGTWPTATEQ